MPGTAGQSTPPAPTHTENPPTPAISQHRFPVSITRKASQGWPEREQGCKEEMLKGKPLQLCSGIGSTKGCQHPWAGQQTSPRRSNSPRAAGCLALCADTTPAAFPSHPAHHSTNPGLTPHSRSTSGPSQQPCRKGEVKVEAAETQWPVSNFTQPPACPHIQATGEARCGRHASGWGLQAPGAPTSPAAGDAHCW